MCFWHFQVIKEKKKEFEQRKKKSFIEGVTNNNSELFENVDLKKYCF